MHICGWVTHGFFFSTVLNGPSKFCVQGARYIYIGEEQIYKIIHQNLTTPPKENASCIPFSVFHVSCWTRVTRLVRHYLDTIFQGRISWSSSLRWRSTSPLTTIWSFGVASRSTLLRSPWRRCSATPMPPPPSAGSDSGSHCIKMKCFVLLFYEKNE